MVAPTRRTSRPQDGELLVTQQTNDEGVAYLCFTKSGHSRWGFGAFFGNLVFLWEGPDYLITDRYWSTFEGDIERHYAEQGKQVFFCSSEGFRRAMTLDRLRRSRIALLDRLRVGWLRFLRWYFGAK